MERGLAMLRRDFGAGPGDLGFVNDVAVVDVGDGSDGWLVIIVVIFVLFGDGRGHAVRDSGWRGLLLPARAIGVVFFQNDHPGSDLIFASKERGEVDPFVCACFVLVGNPERFGGDFAAFDKRLGQLVANASVDAEFVHDEAMDDSWAGQGGGCEEDAEGGVGADEEELGDLAQRFRARWVAYVIIKAV